LESRIEDWDGNDEGIQGSIEAVLALQTYLETQNQPEQKAPDYSLLDNSALIPDSRPIELEQDVKIQTFEALKAQLGKVIDPK